MTAATASSSYSLSKTSCTVAFVNVLHLKPTSDQLSFPTEKKMTTSPKENSAAHSTTSKMDQLAASIEKVVGEQNHLMAAITESLTEEMVYQTALRKSIAESLTEEMVYQTALRKSITEESQKRVPLLKRLKESGDELMALKDSITEEGDETLAALKQFLTVEIEKTTNLREYIDSIGKKFSSL